MKLLCSVGAAKTEGFDDCLCRAFRNNQLTAMDMGRPAWRGVMTVSNWHRLEDVDIPDEGRVRAAVVMVVRSHCHGVAGASVLSRTAARTRVGPWVRAPSRRLCCAARGTGTTMTRSPGCRPGTLPTRFRRLWWRSARTARGLGCRTFMPSCAALRGRRCGRVPSSRPVWARLLAAPGPYLLHIVQDCELV